MVDWLYLRDYAMRVLFWSEDDLLRAKLRKQLPTLRIIAIAIITPIHGL
jgi:hypothetical protein